MKSFLNTPEELFIGACLQFPFYFIVGWWILPIMFVCGILWRLGGWERGHKLFRRIGVPLVVCGASFLCGTKWPIFLAIPFMVWMNPCSYGESSWLFKWLKNDFLVRLIGYGWYWGAFSVIYCFSRP